MQNDSGLVLPGPPAIAPDTPRRRRRELAAIASRDGMEVRYHLRHALSDGAPVCAEATLAGAPRHRLLRGGRWDMPDAERLAASIGAGGWALRAACAAAGGWPRTRLEGPGLRDTCLQDNRIQDLGLSVGLEAAQLAGHAVIGQLADALDQSGIDPERLELSIDEATAAGIGADELLILAAIRDLGIGVALAGFGEEVASLALLRRLPLTGVVLAPALLRHVPQDREDAAILRAVIAAGRTMRLSVTAGGVTSEAQLALLGACGCDAAQGGLFGPPLSTDAVALAIASLAAS